MSVHSGGILLFRFRANKLEVLLVHPGGPFWSGKDEGAWSIPKGVFRDHESPLDAAKREFREETGYEVAGQFTNLGTIDQGMTQQIEEKVVNRLRQVTSSIKQDGTNQVNIIASTAERQAAIEFAKAGAIRPRIVGEAMQAIVADPEVAAAVFEILETQKILEGKGQLTLVPPHSELLNQLIAVPK